MVRPSRWVRRIAIWLTPMYVFAGWVFTTIAGPYDDVMLSVAFLLILASVGHGVTYMAERALASDQPPTAQEFFDDACYYFTGAIFVGGVMLYASDGHRNWF